MWEEQLAPYTSSSQGKHTNILYLNMHNLESSVQITCTSVDCGRKPEHLERIHATTQGRSYKLHTERSRWESNPELSCYGATVLVTTSQ